MRKGLLKPFAALVALALTACLAPAVALAEESANDNQTTTAVAAETLDATLSNATTVSVNTTYNSTITASYTTRAYKFTLANAGKVVLNTNGYLAYLGVKLYDASGEQLWYDNYRWTETIGSFSESYKFFLTKGTYYVTFEKYSYSSDDKYYGDFSFDLAYTKAGVKFEEPQGGSNNDSINVANTITLGTRFKSEISLNDTKDYFKFTLSNASKVTLKTTGYLKYLGAKLYNAAGEQLWYENYSWNETSGKFAESQKLFLTKGTYYLSFEKYGYSSDEDYYGNYFVKVTAVNAKVSFEEPQGGSNNTLATASDISLNMRYRAQISLNDSEDYFKIQLSSARYIRINTISYVDNLNATLYDANGNKVWSDQYDITSPATVSKNNEYLWLTKGTYYLYYQKYSWSSNLDLYGNYNFKVFSTYPSLKKLQKSTTSLKGIVLKWSGLPDADGYKIYRKAGTGKWKLVKTIYATGDEDVTTWTDATTKTTGKKYTYRIRAFKTNADGTIFTQYSGTRSMVFVKATTIKKLTSTTAGKATVRWNTVKKATGYEIRYSTKSTFTSSTTKKVTVKGQAKYKKVLKSLTKGKKYYVQVRAYKVVNGKTYYSAWSAKKAIKVKK